MISIANLNRALSFTCIVVLFFVIAAGKARAQATGTDGTTPLGIAPGAPAGSYPLGGFENVNLYSGNLNFSLPLLSIGGRGSAQTAITLALNTHRWRVIKVPNCGDNPPPPGCSSFLYFPTPNWWTPLKPGYSPGVMVGRNSGTAEGPTNLCGGGPTWSTTLARLTFTAADGTEYEFRDKLHKGEPQSTLGVVNCPFGASRGTEFVTHDGTSAIFISDTVIKDRLNINEQYFFPTGNMFMRDGTRYRIEGGLVKNITDRNGNQIVFTYVANRVVEILDSLKRKVTITYDNNGGSGAKYDEISFKGSNGTTRTIQIWKTSLHNVLRNGFPTTLTPEDLFEQLDGSNTTPHDPEDMVSEVKLPGARSYKFRYNPYGELARIELPTGGAYEYDYDGGQESVTENFYLLNRRVIERRTLPDGASRESLMRYSLSPATDGVKVLVEHLNTSDQVRSKEEHYFYGSPTSQGATTGAYPAWRDGREHKTIMFDEQNNLLREQDRLWEQADVDWWPLSQTLAPSNNSQISRTSTKLDGGLESKQTFEYDDKNNQIELNEFDLGLNSPGPLLRQTVTQYSSTELINGVNYASYSASGVYLPSLPVKQFVYNGSGGLMAKTEYEYDVYSGTHHAALLNRSDMVGHDGTAYGASFVRRGNLTATKVWVNTNDSWISTFPQYDIAGNVIKAIDGLPNPPTVFDFTDKFGTSNGQLSDVSTISELAPNKKTYAFTTGVTNALGHTTTTQFDYYTGAVVDSKDANGVVTTAYYNDALERPTSVELRTAESTSAFSRSNFSYSPPPFTSLTPPTITVTKDLNSFGDGSLKSAVVYDGLGRAKETRQYESASTYIATKTEYDWMGRERRTENPQRAANEDTDGYTETTYDALSRGRFVKSYTESGQLTGTVETQYSGNQITVIDQAGKKRRSITDGLGRMTQMDELNPNGTVYATTSYLYNALDSLVKVTQDGQQRFFAYDSLRRLVRARNPEQQVNINILPQLTEPLTGNNQWVMKYDYDNNGNLKEKVDARNIKTLYNYDPLNRVISRTYQNDPTSTPSVSYFYDNQTLPIGAPTFNRGDSIGRLVAVTYGAGSEGSYIGYEELGRVSTSIQRTDSQNYSMSYSYDLASSLTSQTYPSGKIYRTDYDVAGRVSQVRRFNGQTQEKVYASQMLYWPQGGMKSMTLGNNTVETMKYNSRLQVEKIELRKSDTILLLGLDYTYDTPGQANNNGNVLKQKIRTGANEIEQSYEYDALNRLQWVQESVSGQMKWKQEYGYDRFGNRTSLVNTGSEWQLLPTQSTPAVDATTNRLVGHGYDAAGNMISGTGNTFGYDAESRQVSFNGGAASYVYDGDGKRVKKVVSGQATVMVYNASGQLVAEYSSAGSEESGTSYLTSDHLGSTRLVTDATGTVKARHDYLPFGEEMPSNVSGRGSVAGYNADDSTRQKFTSKERDTESGLDYFGERYYSSAQGRFTICDPLGSSMKVYNPQSMNRYIFVLNNPLRYIDPDGLDVTDNNYWSRLTDEERRRLAPRLTNVRITRNPTADELKAAGEVFNQIISRPNRSGEPTDVQMAERFVTILNFIDAVGALGPNGGSDIWKEITNITGVFDGGLVEVVVRYAPAFAVVLGEAGYAVNEWWDKIPLVSTHPNYSARQETEFTEEPGLHFANDDSNRPETFWAHFDPESSHSKNTSTYLPHFAGKYVDKISSGLTHTQGIDPVRVREHLKRKGISPKTR